MKKNIFIDTDIGSDCDDAGALAVLHALCDMELCNIIGMTYCLSDDSGPATIDAINLYYDKTDIPIGRLKRKGYLPNSEHPFTDAIKTEFVHRHKNGDECEDATRLYRRIFSKQPDHSVTMVAIGPLTNLRLFLESKPDEFSALSGKDLFNKKVERVCIMGGSFTDNAQAEFNILSNVEAVDVFFKECKTEIFMLPYEQALDILVGDELIKAKDKLNPIYRSYELYCGGARSSWDLCTVLYSVVPELKCWNVSAAGMVTVDNEGVTTFIESPDGIVHIVSSNDDNYIKKFLDKLIQKNEEHLELLANNLLCV